MAKSIESAPFFDPEAFDVEKISAFVGMYGIVDDKGRYLHWDQLRWRVPQNDAKNIWLAIKFARMLNSIEMPLLKDQKGQQFTYCKHQGMDARLHRIVEIAGSNIGRIAGQIAADKAQRQYLVSSLIMEEAITSAQLEGASTTLAVAKKMLKEGRKPRDKDERMVLNNYFLLRHALKIKNEPLSVDMILDFHQIATSDTPENDNVPGEFRQANDINIYSSNSPGADPVYSPGDYREIPARMQQLCDFANADHSGKDSIFIPPLVKAIILHFMIGYDHPFRDGNGRTARALFYWYMLKSGYELFRYTSISKHLKSDPKGYGLSYVYTEKDQGDLTYFIDYQLDTILKAFDELNAYLHDKSQAFSEVAELLQDSRLSHELNFVQKDLIKQGINEPGRGFSVQEVASSYELAENTARTHLKRMVELKLFLETKDGRRSLYFAPADLRSRLKTGCDN